MELVLCTEGNVVTRSLGDSFSVYMEHGFVIFAISNPPFGVDRWFSIEVNRVLYSPIIVPPVLTSSVVIVVVVCVLFYLYFLELVIEEGRLNLSILFWITSSYIEEKFRDTVWSCTCCADLKLIWIITSTI